MHDPSRSGNRLATSRQNEDVQPLDQYPELAAAAARLSDDLKRVVAERLAMLSALRTGERDLRQPSIAQLEERLDELDIAAFDLRDRADQSDPGLMDEYQATFRRGRAVAGRLALKRGQVEVSIYESLHALGANERLVLDEFTRAIGGE